MPKFFFFVIYLADLTLEGVVGVKNCTKSPPSSACLNLPAGTITRLPLNDATGHRRRVARLRCIFIFSETTGVYTKTMSKRSASSYCDLNNPCTILALFQNCTGQEPPSAEGIKLYPSRSQNRVAANNLGLILE